MRICLQKQTKQAIGERRGLTAHKKRWRANKNRYDKHPVGYRMEGLVLCIAWKPLTNCCSQGPRGTLRAYSKRQLGRSQESVSGNKVSIKKVKTVLKSCQSTHPQDGGSTNEL